MTVDLEEPSEQEYMTVLSIPSAEITGGQYVIPIGGAQGNIVFLDVLYAGSGDCYVDLDIANDANFDGDQANDRDLLCNEAKYVTIDDYSDAIHAKIVYEDPTGQSVSHGILFSFIDKQIELTPEQQSSYNEIQSFTKTLPSENEDQSYIKSLLKEMSTNIKL